MSRPASRTIRSDRGDVLIAGLLLSIALLLLTGVAVDVGDAFIARRHLVSLADQAALSASQELDLDALHNGHLALDPERAQAVALQTSASEPGTEGIAEATSTSIRVRISQPMPTTLLRLVGLSHITIVATATATPRTP